ncbi:hypothetical protein B1222_07765 [Paenibacillus larvae subsp. pulvifaciens]|nr:hypothetical protein B1222_07765 [Paenibacillus larvae subsp. pulvifaciens]AQZ46306.1 hypothetical protein B5S25_06350 [Paenibacillus larvae subsp. pulvifaciens]
MNFSSQKDKIMEYYQYFQNGSTFLSMKCWCSLLRLFLIYTNQSISEIAFLFKFCSQSYYTRYLKS